MSCTSSLCTSKALFIADNTISNYSLTSLILRVVYCLQSQACTHTRRKHCHNFLLTLPFFKILFSCLRLNYGTRYLITYVHFSHFHILSRLYLLFATLAVMYLVNSNFVYTVFLCCVLFLCITSLL